MKGLIILKEFLRKSKRVFSIFLMVFGGIGCASLLFSIPMVFVSDDIDEKLLTVFSLLLSVAFFAALFVLGMHLYGKRSSAEQNSSIQTTETEKPVEKAPEPTPPAPAPETPAPYKAETPQKTSPYPQKNYEDASYPFVEELADIPLYTIYTEEMHFVMTDLGADLLLFPKREDAEEYVRLSGQKALSVMELSLVIRNDILNACRCAGYWHAAIYAGNGIYRRAPFSMLETAFHLPAAGSLGIAIPDLLPRFHSLLIQMDYTKRKQEQTGEEPKEFWMRHLNELLVENAALLLNAPLTLPILWDSKNEPSVQALPGKTNDGCTVIPVYSDRYALEQRIKAPVDCVAVPHLLLDILQNMKSHPEVDGVILNPGRENVFLSRKVLESAETHKVFFNSSVQARSSRLPQPMRQPTPDYRLYLMPVLFDGENTVPDEPDHTLHIWPEAAKQLANGRKLTLRQSLPENLVPTKKADGRIMHGQLIKNPKTGQEFVPLYSTLDPIYKVYSENVRLSVITFGEARKMSHGYAGVILDPGPSQHVILNP